MKILKRVHSQSEIMPYQVSDMIKEIQDTIYNVSAGYLRAKGWDLSDIADYFVVEVTETQPGIIRAEIRGELSEDELFGLMRQLDRVIAVKFDEEAYFDAVTPGIAEAFIHTGVQSCTQVTASNKSDLTEGSLNYVTPEMKQLKRALSKIHVDSDNQLHELVDSLLSNEPINLVPETRALKRAMDNLVVDSEDEKRSLVYEVAKDLGVIESSSAIKAYTFDESEDGWGEDVEDILSQVFARVEDLMYEVRNTVRGANTDCETTEDLAEYIRNIATEFEEAADEIDSL